MAGFCGALRSEEILVTARDDLAKPAGTPRLARRRRFKGKLSESPLSELIWVVTSPLPERTRNPYISDLILLLRLKRVQGDEAVAVGFGFRVRVDINTHDLVVIGGGVGGPLR
jgi:hypothetical protein